MLCSHVRRLVDNGTKFLLPLIVLTILTGFAVTAVAWIGPDRPAAPSSPPSPVAQTATPQQRRALRRNLSLQPEAFNFSRRVGQRFHTAKRELSEMSATLDINSERHNLLISRRQDARGESLIIRIHGRALPLAWDHERGGRETGGDGGDAGMRALAERIALDSPEQFVLAQLRGASYGTVARQARPVADDGADGYTGPVYDIVRISEPGKKNERGASSWRLFYINTGTGLIDKVVTEEDGMQVEAVFSDWREQDGEKFPARIRWTRGGLPLMELTVNSVSFAPAL